MDANTPPPPPPPAPDPTNPQALKPQGIPTVAKVGIGCGVLAFIAVIVLVFLVSWCKRTVGDVVRDFSENPERATAELVVRLNPDLDLVESDDEAKTTTFRDKSGKVTTLSWEDLAEGRLTVTDSEGNEIVIGGGNLDSVPAWVPRVPGDGQVVSSQQSVEDGRLSGTFMVATSMAAGEMEAHFAAAAAELGMEPKADARQSTDGGEMRIIGYEGGGRSLNVTIVRGDDEQMMVNVIYQEEGSP